MKLYMEFGNDVVTLPAACARHAADATELDWKLLFLIASDVSVRENFDAARLSRVLDASIPEISASLAFWRGAGVIKHAGPKRTAKGADEESDGGSSGEAPAKPNVGILRADSVPTYTGEQLRDIMSTREGIDGLIRECQNIFGKVFGSSDINVIIALCDQLSLSYEYILLLFKHCREIEKTSVRYAGKVALSLYDEGIDSFEKLETYLSEKEKRGGFEGKMRNLFGIGTRALTAKEKKFFAEWFSLGYADDVIKLAFDIACDKVKTGSPLPYMNKVLLAWKDDGVVNAADVAQRAEKRKATAPGEGGASFDADEFFRVASEHTKRKNGSGQNENG